MRLERKGRVGIRAGFGCFILEDDVISAAVFFQDWQQNGVYFLPFGINVGDRVGYVLSDDQLSAKEVWKL